MTENERQKQALCEYITHMEEILENILGVETLDRYIYTNMIYLALQLRDGNHSIESLYESGMSGLEKYL